MDPKNDRSVILRALSEPLHDYMNALGALLEGGNAALRVIAALAAMLAAWWVYVPVHELLHAAGAVIGGGEVSRLELSPIYGAHLLKKIFPFIEPASEYAGRLSGFDTRGSDLTYLLTVFLPYLLTIFIGVPLLKHVAASGASTPAGAIKFGACIPLAYAPFISITGDYYEMGSIIVTRIASLFSTTFDVERLRSDDLILLVKEIFFSGADWTALDALIAVLSFSVGIDLIFGTYLLGSLVSRLISKGRQGGIR